MEKLGVSFFFQACVDAHISISMCLHTCARRRALGRGNPGKEERAHRGKERQITPPFLQFPCRIEARKFPVKYAKGRLVRAARCCSALLSTHPHTHSSTLYYRPLLPRQGLLQQGVCLCQGMVGVSTYRGGVRNTRNQPYLSHHLRGFSNFRSSRKKKLKSHH